jgi:hypothetical protein
MINSVPNIEMRDDRGRMFREEKNQNTNAAKLLSLTGGLESGGSEVQEILKFCKSE